MKKVLIIGKDAYLASGLKFDKSKVETDFVGRFAEVEDWDQYDTVVNFCIQPEHYSRLLSNEEMIDVQIAKRLNPKTNFVFLSSRKVYGSHVELDQYRETDPLQPYDYYSKNKVNIEHQLQQILGDRLLILRTGNIVGIPPRHNSPTFINWLKSELENYQHVVVTADRTAVKDFVTKDYFQYVLKTAVENGLTGIYNVGSGFGITIEDLLTRLVAPQKLKFEQKEDRGEQFILNCDKLHQVAKALTKEELFKTCERVKTYMEIKNEPNPSIPSVGQQLCPVRRNNSAQYPR